MKIQLLLNAILCVCCIACADTAERPVYQSLIPALASGKLDIIANHLMVTQERAKKISFSDAYYQGSGILISLKKHLPEPTGFHSSKDLENKRVAVKMGSTHDTYLSSNYKKMDILRAESISDAVLALQQERCEAVLIDNISFKNISKKYDNLEILDEALFFESFGVGFSLQQTELRDSFNLFLKEIQVNGLYDQIYDRWVNHADTAEMPTFQLPKNGNPIRAGITGTTVPFAFMKGQQLVGFDIEILCRFAERIQRPIEFSDISFGGLIAALSAGKVDLISAAMTITEERSKSVAFSDPYFKSKATLGILRKNSAKASSIVESRS